MKKIKLGYEVGTGNQIDIEPSHLIATGITQLAGKTVTLESLMRRSDYRGIVFKTKIGERGFSEGRIVAPFFRERSDYEFVKSLIEAYSREKLYIEKGTLMELCKGSKDLIEIEKRIDGFVSNEKIRGIKREIYVRLQHYLGNLIPQIQDANFSSVLQIEDGINIMDLEKFSEEAQSLIIESVVSEVLRTQKNIIIIIPEAWKFIPQKYNNPCKRIVESFIRQGATNNNYIWIDSMPNYEVIMTRVNGKIKPMRFDELFNLEGITEISYSIKEIQGTGLLQKVQHDIKTITDNVEILDSGGSRLQWYKLNKVFRHPYTGEILSINTLDGLIDVSPNHPILIQQSGVPTLEAHKLQIGNKLISRRPEPKNRFHNNRTLFVGTTDLAWLLGFFCAEGWIHNGHFYLANNNKKLLEKSKMIIATTFHRTASILKSRKDVYELDCNSPNLANYFKKECYCNIKDYNSTTKSIPLSILNGHKNVKKAFLQGYLIGDGSLDKTRNRWTFTSTSRTLIIGIIECLNAVYGKLNYTTHIRDDKPDVVQININKTNERKLERDRIKKITHKLYSGFLYDIEVNSPKHTFYMGINNIKVHNSQDMAGVDKIPLKQISTWILGYQSERNEVRHTLDQLPPPESHKPTVQDIMTLGTGFFYYASREITTKVYVQPYWIDDDTAKQVALGKIKVEQIKKPIIQKIKDDHEPKPPHPSGKLSDETLAYVDKMIGNVQREIDEVKEKLRTKPSHDEVINQIIARIPKVTSGTTVYEIPPLEAIKKKFLQEAKDKIISDVSSISNDAKRMLKYLETRGIGTSVNEIAIKCFMKPSGANPYNKFVNDCGKELEIILIAKKQTNGKWLGSLKTRIIELIKVHEATVEEIENLYNHILMELLGEKIETISK